MVTKGNASSFREHRRRKTALFVNQMLMPNSNI